MATSERVTFRPYIDTDAESVAGLLRESFRIRLRSDLWRRSGRVLARAGRVEASICIRRFGQFFGGCCVPAAGLTMAAVAPERRGRGLGRQLLLETIVELDATRTPIAVLYPTTIPFYRQLGFEIAGARTRYRAPVAALTGGAVTDVEPWGCRDLGQIGRCYERFASRTNGLLQRSGDWWLEDVLRADGRRRLHRFMVRAKDEVIGYTIYAQEPAREASEYCYSIDCRDLVWTDEHSLCALLGLFAAQRALGRELSWSGPRADPLGMRFDQGQVAPQWSLVWMARLIRVGAALEARGYRRRVREAVELCVDDWLIPGNCGLVRLEVRDGRGTVTRGVGDAPRIGIGTLTALYTGWLQARDAARLGLLEGGSVDDLEILEEIFGGAEPWMSEHF